MNQFLLVVAVALTVGLIVFGITVLVTGDDAGLAPAEPDGRAVPLPTDRPLSEADLTEIKFDVAVRGYRMAQVDGALRRAAYDIGYKEELIRVLQAEVDALREGRMPEAEALRRAREAAVAPLQAKPSDADDADSETPSDLPEAAPAPRDATPRTDVSVTPTEPDEPEAVEEPAPAEEEPEAVEEPAGDRRG